MPGASCKLTNSKGAWFIGPTPGSTTVHKAFGDMATECSMPRGVPNREEFPSHVNLGMFGNILMGLGGITIGISVDSGTGAGFNYPTNMKVDMCKNAGAETAASPATPTPAATSIPVSPVYEPQQKTAPGPSVPRESKWVFDAERLARTSGCADRPAATLSGKGPAVETYSFQCSNGDVLSVRCEYGNCRALR